MDTIDVEFKNFLGDKYGYTNTYANKQYTAKIFPVATPTQIIVSASDPLKTKAFALAIGKLLQAGASALLPVKPAKEMSTDFNQTEFS